MNHDPGGVYDAVKRASRGPLDRHGHARGDVVFAHGGEASGEHVGARRVDRRADSLDDQRARMHGCERRDVLALQQAIDLGQSPQQGVRLHAAMIDHGADV